jgi:hypothetical protein
VGVCVCVRGSEGGQKGCRGAKRVLWGCVRGLEGGQKGWRGPNSQLQGLHWRGWGVGA